MPARGRAGASASAARFHYENTHAETPAEPATVPLGRVSFAGDFRRFVDRHHENVVSRHVYTVGGHYVAHQAPDHYGWLLADNTEPGA